jgi:hypothetical protein
MKFNKLSLKDKALLERFLGLSAHELSVYAFENIYIWQGLFDISWTIIDGALCLFFRDKIGCFLYLPPLAKELKPGAVSGAFRAMDKFNQNQSVSRIENIEEKDLLLYRGLGYECRSKSSDYLCLRASLAALKGDRFKSKRSCVNYFAGHYNFEYREFLPADRHSCLNLYKAWMKNRQAQNKDGIYKAMLLDGFSCLEVLLRDFAKLKLIGRVVRMDKQIKGFTFGFGLNADSFCILFETTDLSYKGLSQYIFQRFCAELENYKYINIMDDSGLENLKRVKLSYQPARLIPSYIITRKNE